MCPFVPAPATAPTPAPELLQHLAQSTESEIIDGFRSSRYLNDRLRVPNKIGSFVSSATSPLVVKSVTKLNW